MVCLFVTCCGHVMSRIDWSTSKSKVTDHQQEGRPRIMYTQKELLPTKGLECGGFPRARKFEVGCLEVKYLLQ